MTQGTIKPSPTGSKQDLQALSTGQNTLQNVIGAVGQGLVPTGSALLGALAGSGAYTQQILGGVAPALAGSTPESVRATAGAIGGLFFPLGPQISTNTSPVSPANTPGFNPYDQAGF
jgi:hypothetical protein